MRTFSYKLGGSILAATAAAGIAFNSNVPYTRKSHVDVTEAVEKEAQARSVIDRYMATRGIPGLTVSVSVDGHRVYEKGFGLSDIETGSKCTAKTVMRIASISKPITSTISALLVDQGKIDLDKLIQTYLPEFPKKSFNGKSADITMRMLLSHCSGIRHYEKAVRFYGQFIGEPKVEGDGNALRTSEFYLNKPFSGVMESLELFANDELVSEPSKTFTYTTHGFTVAAAICEKMAGVKFEVLLDDLFRRLGMNNTTLDRNDPIIYNRAKYYKRNDKGILVNTPEVDNSYKWAGGGILSTAPDLVKFANAMLYSHQSATSSDVMISKKTIDEFWKGEITTSRHELAALGWIRVNSPEGGEVGGVQGNRARGDYWYHTGGAVGASSVLLIEPRGRGVVVGRDDAPQGVCVAILVNLQSCSVKALAEELCDIFRVTVE